MARSNGWKGWTGAEVDVLRAMHPNHGMDAIAEALGRGRLSVVAKAKAIRLMRPEWDRKPWSKEDCQLMLDLYPSQGPRAMALLLGRTYPGVISKAIGLGLKHGEQYSQYPPEIIELIVLQKKIERALDDRETEHDSNVS